MAYFIVYAVNVPQIPKDVYNVFQIFFNEIFISKIGKWDKFWEDNSSGFFRDIYPDLLTKINQNMDKTNEVHESEMRTTAMLLKLALMTFYNYQQAAKAERQTKAQTDPMDHIIIKILKKSMNPLSLKSIDAVEKASGLILMLQLLIAFKDDRAIFDLNDPHFIDVLNRFFSKGLISKERNEGITHALKYIIFRFD